MLSTTAFAPPATVADSELLDEARAAALCGMSPRTLRRRSDDGVAPPPIKVGRLRRYSRQALLNWIAGGCRPVAPPAANAESAA